MCPTRAGRTPRCAASLISSVCRAMLSTAPGRCPPCRSRARTSLNGPSFCWTSTARNRCSSALEQCSSRWETTSATTSPTSGTISLETTRNCLITSTPTTICTQRSSLGP
uniref:Uncharacterized protein n=1 Tax=Ixodes ricinus TaxID=34613 RepID=A0A6B0UJ12_IXORI